MSFDPQFQITRRLLSQVEAITTIRERILGAAVQVSWIPSLQKDSRSRGAHASTAIEGNPLTLAQVRVLEEGGKIAPSTDRARREVLNYFAGLRFIGKFVNKPKLVHGDIHKLHKILAGAVMDQGEAGRYRTIHVRVGKYTPPPPSRVSGLMFELLEWWNGKSKLLSPILSSAILHHQFESIHPFADGNGRTGRALALWELYRRGFDTHHIFAVDEFYWEDRPRYYESLNEVHKSGGDLTHWLEYSAEGLHQTLERAWTRLQTIKITSRDKLILRPRQEQLLRLLRDHAGVPPAEIWKELSISRQGAMDLLRPLLEGGIVEKVGGKKTGRYVLKKL